MARCCAPTAGWCETEMQDELAIWEDDGGAIARGVQGNASAPALASLVQDRDHPPEPFDGAQSKPRLRQMSKASSKR